MNFGAVILAGGESRRMARDKAWIEIEGRPLLMRQIELVREFGAAEIFISGRADTDYSKVGCPVLLDQIADAGPLAGVARALTAVNSSKLLVLAVDMPRLTVQLLQSLAGECEQGRGVVPRVNDLIEPLTAFYSKAALPLATTLLRNGQNAVKGFARECVEVGLAKFVQLPESAARYFANLNSPEDLAALNATAVEHNRSFVGVEREV